MRGRTAFILLACVVGAVCAITIEQPYGGGVAAVLIFGSIWLAGSYLD